MGKDPYRYFRVEARDHVDGLSAGVLELEKRPGDRDLVERLLRYAHTLKGAARVVGQQEIADASHSVEEILSSIRGRSGAVQRQDINDLLALVDSIARHVQALPGPGSQRPPAGVAGSDVVHAPAASDSLRIDVAELDPLLHGIAEMGIHVGALRRQAMELDDLVDLIGDYGGTAVNAPARDAPVFSEGARSSLRQFRQSLRTQIDRTERELLDLQDRAGGIRLVPARSLFPMLERACRDAADSLGKRVEFRAQGGDSRLESHVLRGIGEALIHLVRNAVSHGIEIDQERLAAGKTLPGTVEINVERHGSRVAFTCRDDGQGIDVERIRRTAMAQGRLSPDDTTPLSLDRATQLLLGGGITTAGDVTQVSGRGVGLSAVREALARLNGAAEVESVPGAGTAVRVTVPVSLESVAVLDVEAAGQRVSLPFSAVVRVLPLSDRLVAHAATWDTILFDGATLPIAALRRMLFQARETPASPGGKFAVIIDANGSRIAMEVDRVFGRSTAILRAMPAMIKRQELVLGASIDASGDPQLVLDPNRLVEVARSAGGGPASIKKFTSKPRVLVIDDSLTTRMLEETILTAAGYDVDLAVSGEDALDKAGRHGYAIFIVDVEMPGMSGFEFIAATRSDPNLRQTPAVLVTSRDSPEDRARGQAVGASAYIVKGEFDQATFLATVRRLIG
jgi:two-component system chemotaxis sensor kinase CheA